MAVGAVGLFLGMTGLYQLYFGGMSGQTPGMRLVGIRLISARGGAPGPARGLLRLLALVPSLLPAGLGWLWALFDREHRALHDHLAGTLRDHRRRLSADPAMASRLSDRLRERGTGLRRHHARRRSRGRRSTAARSTRRCSRSTRIDETAAVGGAGRGDRPADARAGAVREPGQVREPRRLGDRARRRLVGARPGRAGRREGRRAADAVRRAARAAPSWTRRRTGSACRSSSTSSPRSGWRRSARRSSIGRCRRGCCGCSRAWRAPSRCAGGRPRTQAGEGRREAGRGGAAAPVGRAATRQPRRRTKSRRHRRRRRHTARLGGIARRCHAAAAPARRRARRSSRCDKREVARLIGELYGKEAEKARERAGGASPGRTSAPRPGAGRPGGRSTRTTTASSGCSRGWRTRSRRSARPSEDELRALTGEYFGYHFDLPRREREQARSRWQAWWYESGRARKKT